MGFGSQYPIWNVFSSKAYERQIKFGTKEYDSLVTYIGTSSKNSHELARTSTTYHVDKNGDRHYTFFVDGKRYKSAILKKGSNGSPKITNYHPWCAHDMVSIEEE